MIKTQAMDINGKELTRAEEQIMQILWDIRKGFVKDILQRLPPPKPAYSTVSTIVRILVQKGYAGYRAYGKTHEYFPLVSREAYRSHTAKKLLQHYFDNSVGSLVSFFVDKKKIDVQEADEIIKLLRDFKKEES
ncbi:BlaI/MecI/CopY family transcriptional regulator [Compostibacter hankyongensis]|uniref:BlaI/MecI/CopY family transcriptional regulator n=1 Tax=Compostibacter hankyongensis TaxID=1007089 RepID=A0ABP8FHB4_9BACT